MVLRRFFSVSSSVEQKKPMRTHNSKRTHHLPRRTRLSAHDEAPGHPPISDGAQGSGDFRLHPATAGGDRDGCPGRRPSRVGNQDLPG